MFKVTKEKYEQAHETFDKIKMISIGFSMFLLIIWIFGILVSHKFIIYKPMFIMLSILLLLFISMSIFDYVLRVNIDDKSTNKKKENDQ